MVLQRSAATRRVTCIVGLMFFVGTTLELASVASAASVPGAPTDVTVEVEARSATLTFLPPESDGGSPITKYRATCVSGDGGATRIKADTESPLTVGMLTSGASYACTVTAANALGISTPSAPSETFSVPTAPASTPPEISTI